MTKSLKLRKCLLKVTEQRTQLAGLTVRARTFYFRVLTLTIVLCIIHSVTEIHFNLIKN